MIKYVHCETQEEWDFAAKKLNRTCDVPYKECGDSICITNPGWSDFKSRITDGKMYSFQEWCDKFGHVNPFIIKETSKETSKEEELLAYARKNYPIGTRYIPAHIGKGINEVFKKNYRICNEGVYVTSKRVNKDYNECLHYKGKWAKIVSKPEEVKEVKPQYIVGKWYTSKNWFPGSCCKFANINDKGAFGYSERIYDGEYEKEISYWRDISSIVEAPLELVQPFLPEGHFDKIAVKKSDYQALPFPTDEGYIKLRVIKDITKKGLVYQLPDLIPTGSLTWIYNKGDYIVCNEEVGGWIRKGEIAILGGKFWNTEQVNKHHYLKAKTVHDPSGNGCSRKVDFRHATKEEIDAYKNGIRNVSDIKHSLQDAVDKFNTQSIYNTGKQGLPDGYFVEGGKSVKREPKIGDYVVVIQHGFNTGEIDRIKSKNTSYDNYWELEKHVVVFSYKDNHFRFATDAEIHQEVSKGNISLKNYMIYVTHNPVFDKPFIPNEVQLLQPKEDKRFNTSVNKIESIKIQLKQKSKLIKF